MTTIPVAYIKVGDRARKDYAGIDTLAASIHDLGLLHPIVVTADYELVAGGRRLQAVKSLGWEETPVTVASSLSDVEALLRAESDENTERQPLKPSEAADLAAKIEAVLKPMAAQRQSPGTNQHTEVEGKLPATKEPRPRDAAAKATGTSATSIRKTRHVQEVIQSESTPEPVREIAREALSEIDSTGKVDAGHKKVKAATAAAKAVEQFPDLAYYFDKGEYGEVNSLATALRGYEEPELSSRLNNLRAAIAMHRRRDNTPAAQTNQPDFEALADGIFVAVNDALQVIAKNGGADTIRAAQMTANPISVDLWRSNFEGIQSVAAELMAATKPQLRRVQ